MSIIFRVKEDSIKTIGLDNLDNPSSFSKAPTADFEIKTKKYGTFRIEFQCGFQGVNDIKEHKVLEAARVYKNDNIRSLILHVDLFNGCVAFVDISNIDEKNINWEYRQQFEGKKVFHINGFDLAPEKCDRNKARNISNDGHYGNRNQTIS